MRLLLAESDPERGSGLRAALGKDGYATDWVQTGAHMGSALATHKYDCALLGWPVPDVARDALLPSIHRHQSSLPIIFMTSASAIEDRVALIDQGADDCLVRPIHVDELTARIRSLMRRSLVDGEAKDVLAHGSIRLHPQRLCATWRQRDVRLTQSEFSVLEVLVRKKNQVLSRAHLEESLYGWGEEVTSNAVEVYVHYLRRKFHPDLILTVRGVGYQLNPEPI